MGIWRLDLVFTIFSIACIGFLFLIQSVYGINYVLDADSCLAIGGTWNGSTCTFSSTGLSIPLEDTLTIPPGTTLQFLSNRNLINSGAITNEGTILLASGEIRNQGGSTFVNDGTLTITNGGKIENRNSAFFTNTNTITLHGSGSNSARINNQNDAEFVNFGTITLNSGGSNSARINNLDQASFTNSGTISLIGLTDNNSGQLINRGNSIFENTQTIIISGGSGSNSGFLENTDFGSFINTGTITINGNDGRNTGLFRNLADATFTNQGMISVTGGDGNNSGGFDNAGNSIFTNLGTMTIIAGLGKTEIRLEIAGTSTFTNDGQLTTDDNLRNLSTLTNSGTLTVGVDFVNDDTGIVTNYDSIIVTESFNNDGTVLNCATITFGDFNGNPIEPIECPVIEPIVEPVVVASKSTSYEDPTIGKSRSGSQVVENGICIDIQCWTVTADYHQDFELVELLSDSVHTISTTVFCQSGTIRCSYVAFGVSPYGTNINNSVWKVILQKDHRNNWEMNVIDPDGYLGEVTATAQEVSNGKYLGASATIEFKKPTPGMILNVEVRDTNGGYRDFKFNDGIEIKDVYAYPMINAEYDSPLKIKKLCINENPNKRYTCAFELVRDWATKNAEAKLKEILSQ